MRKADRTILLAVGVLGMFAAFWFLALAPKRQELSPEEFDELPQGGSGSAEDGSTETTSPSAKTMFPSSFGMTFCVDLDARELQLSARWGHYHRDRSATLTTPGGEKKLVWKRSP